MRSRSAVMRCWALSGALCCLPRRRASVRLCSAPVVPSSRDPLQFVHAHFPREPLRSLQRFHRWMHTKRPIRGQIVWGVVSQMMLVVLVVGLAKAAHEDVFGIVAWGVP